MKNKTTFAAPMATLLLFLGLFVQNTFAIKPTAPMIWANYLQGKAYWVSYYTKGRTVFISYVYNNDCFHCSNEINEAFKKWLILNDYDNNARTVYMTNLSDENKGKLDKRREDKIIELKQQGYAVKYISFTYTDK